MINVAYQYKDLICVSKHELGESGTIGDWPNEIQEERRECPSLYFLWPDGLRVFYLYTTMFVQQWHSCMVAQ